MSASDKNVLAPLLNAAPPHQHKGVKSTSRYLTMHDGVQIAADIMLPADIAPHAQ